jgi:hypothetical protein
VNGLAQFGRNALERIAQLERELAEARALIAAGDAVELWIEFGQNREAMRIAGSVWAICQPLAILLASKRQIGRRARPVGLL